MTATCHRFDLDAYCGLLESEGERFVSVISDRDPEHPVMTCPGWTIRDLVEHVGGLHRWAEAHVRLRSQRRIRARELDLGTPEDAAGYRTWLRAGVARLVDTLGAAQPDAPVWAWGSDKHARFWGRRMLFETTIHRADAELALGPKLEIDTSVALDGIDEFLDNLPHAEYFAPKVRELRGAGERLCLHARDAETRWTIRLSSDGFTWDHSTEDTTHVMVEGEAAGLLLFAYGRVNTASKHLRVTGDDDLLSRWVENSAI